MSFKKKNRSHTLECLFSELLLLNNTCTKCTKYARSRHLFMTTTTAIVQNVAEGKKLPRVELERKARDG